MSGISLNPFVNPAPYHLLIYGTLLGTNLWHSFVGGIITFRTLSRPQFSQLQQKVFPWYFGAQSIFPALLALSWPAPRTGSIGSSSWTHAASSHIPGGLTGSLTTASSTRTALVAMQILGVVNWFVFGPMTTATMRERKHQETRDGKKYWEKGERSKEMTRLNKRFGILHGLSSLVNVVNIGVCIWYGFILGSRL